MVKVYICQLLDMQGSYPESTSSCKQPLSGQMHSSLAPVTITAATSNRQAAMGSLLITAPIHFIGRQDVHIIQNECSHDT